MVSQLLTLYTTPVVYLGLIGWRSTLCEVYRSAIRLRSLQQRTRHEYFGAIYPAADWHVAADAWPCAGRAFWRFDFLPVAPLPQVDFPVISCRRRSCPGASPETMASAVATPLERQFGRIAGVNQMTSTSQLGSTGITLQFDLNRNIDAAARDVQAAINAARSQLPANLPSNPDLPQGESGRCADHDSGADLRRITLPRCTTRRFHPGAETGAGARRRSGIRGGGARPAVRVEVNPTLLNKLGIGLDNVRTALGSANANRPKGNCPTTQSCWTFDANDQFFKARRIPAADRRLSKRRAGAPGRRCRCSGFGRGHPQRRHLSTASPRSSSSSSASPARTSSTRSTGSGRCCRSCRPRFRRPSTLDVVMDRTTTIRASVQDIEITLMISVVLVILVVFVFPAQRCAPPSFPASPCRFR